MKKRLLLFLLFASTGSFAQSWAAPGATWFYDYQYFNCSGFECIRKVGDTIIANKQYDQLEIFRKYTCFNPYDTGSYTVAQREFTRADSGVVYYYRDSADFVLYNFNAVTGDRWTLRSESWMQGSPCDTASVITDSTSTMIVNGDTLRMIYTSPVGQSFDAITFDGPIVEKLGGMRNLFPYSLCIADIPQGYNLRCYYDSSGWTYHSPFYYNGSCDNIVGLQETVTPEKSINVFADGQQLNIHCSGMKAGDLIRVYDCRGSLVQEMLCNSDENAELSFAGQPGGIYFVTVSSTIFFGSRSFLFTGN